LCIVHLAVRDQVGSVIVLLAKRARGFDDEALARLQALAPVLAVGDRLQERLDNAPRATAPVRLRCEDQRLTERQREIVERVALGHSNEQIAVGMGLSANTVRNHLARIFTRLGCANRADLVRLAVLRPVPQDSGLTP
jgi:DNA-binding CsgD family transcriptional regulator